MTTTTTTQTNEQTALAKTPTPVATPATPAKARVKTEDDDDADEPRDPTDLEIAIEKAEARFAGLKHVEVKAAVLDYMFPILRAVAKQNGDLLDVVEQHEGEIDDLHRAFDAGALGAGTDQQINTLELALGTIVSLGALLDETMVVAGFMVVNKEKGIIEPTKKIPRNLNTKYLATVEQLTKTLAIMQVAMRAKQAEDERQEVLDRIENEIEEAQKALEVATTDEAKAEIQAKIATLEAQFDSLNVEDVEEVDEVEEKDGEKDGAKDGE